MIATVIRLNSISLIEHFLQIDSRNIYIQRRVQFSNRYSQYLLSFVQFNSKLVENVCNGNYLYSNYSSINVI